MPATITSEPNDICVLRISGLLTRDEFVSQQDWLAKQIDGGAKPRVLVIVEAFEGWERRADWNDFDYLLTYSGEIARIAVVAEPQWERDALGFAGAGVRPAPVKIFRPDELAE